MNKWYRIFIFLLIPALMFQCMENDNPIEEQLKKDKSKIDQYAKENSLQGGYILNDIYKVLVTPGVDTTMAKTNSGVRIRYRMLLLDGTEIDSSTIFYQHGQGFVFPGWEASVSSMKHKEVSTFLIPSFYAYGKSTGQKGNITIPPNSIIKMEIQLVNIVSQNDVPQAYAYFKNMKGYLSQNGVFYTITDSTNQAAHPKTGESVTIKYKGYFLDQYQFDKNDNFTFVLGSTSMIAGFNEVIPLLKVGQKATVVIPSKLAYGDQTITKDGRIAIPANATLIFDLEILDSK